jgi:hypothetical protein
MTIPYERFVSLSPSFHEICSSDFVDKRWILALKESLNRCVFLDWRNRAFSQFELLSDLCQLANKTIDDAVRRFLKQSLVASSVLTEDVFKKQINGNLQQLFQSTMIYFSLLIDTARLVTQVDQPYMGSIDKLSNGFDANLIPNVVINETSNEESLQVSFFFKTMKYLLSMKNISKSK